MYCSPHRCVDGILTWPMLDVRRLLADSRRVGAAQVDALAGILDTTGRAVLLMHSMSLVQHTSLPCFLPSPGLAPHSAYLGPLCPLYRRSPPPLLTLAAAAAPEHPVPPSVARPAISARRAADISAIQQPPLPSLCISMDAPERRPCIAYSKAIISVTHMSGKDAPHPHSSPLARSDSARRPFPQHTAR